MIKLGLLFGLIVSSSVMALTGDVSHQYEVDRQLQISVDREPQSEQEFVGPKLPDDHWHKENLKDTQPEG